MKLDFAMFANSAMLSPNGLFGVLDGGLEWVMTSSFPALCPNLVLLARVSFAPDECGKQYDCVVKVTSPDGSPLEPDLVVSLKPLANKRHADRPSTFTAHYRYDRFAFQKAGFHRFCFFIGEVSLGEISLEAVTAVEGSTT